MPKTQYGKIWVQQWLADVRAIVANGTNFTISYVITETHKS